MIIGKVVVVLRSKKQMNSKLEQSSCVGGETKEIEVRKIAVLKGFV